VNPGMDCSSVTLMHHCMSTGGGSFIRKPMERHLHNPTDSHYRPLRGDRFAGEERRPVCFFADALDPFRAGSANRF
jgi:hypothetical protein